MSTSLTFDIIARDRASDKFDKFGRSVDGTSGKLKKFAKIGGAAVGAAALVVGKFAIDSIGAASRVEQSFGALESVYGKNAKQVKRWAEGAADSVGLAKSEYANLSTLVGSQLQGMGTSSDKAAKKSKDLIKMGADLAATYGGSVKDAVEAVSSTLKGETDPIERYGVSIKASDISARMAADGLDKLEGSAKKQATAQTVLTMLTEQTSKAHGAFGREADTLAGKQERLKAKFENVKASIGEKLLPVATKFFGFLLDKGVPAVEKLGDWFMKKLMPPIREFAEKWAEQARGRMAALKDAFEDAKPFLELVGKIIMNVVVPGLKKLLDVVGPVMNASIRGLGKALEFVGKAGTWMWNNALQPAFKFLIKGIGVVADGFSAMLGAMGKVPGFGWAKDAAIAMGKAADKAYAVADGLKKIPPKKQVIVSVKYVYSGLKSPTRSGNGTTDKDTMLDGILPRGLVATAQTVATDLMAAIGRGIQDGGKKLDTILESSRDRIKTKLSQIRGDMASMSESIASALNPTDFGSGLTELMASLTGNNSALSGLSAVFEKLKGSVSKGFLSSLMQSGNATLATQLANDPTAAANASALFDSNAAMAQGLGDQTAQAVLGDKIVGALKDEIGKLRDQLKDSPGKTARELAKELKDLKLVVEGLSAGQKAHIRGAGGF